MEIIYGFNVGVGGLLSIQRNSGNEISFVLTSFWYDLWIYLCALVIMCTRGEKRVEVVLVNGFLELWVLTICTGRSDLYRDFMGKKESGGFSA